MRLTNHPLGISFQLNRLEHVTENTKHHLHNSQRKVQAKCQCGEGEAGNPNEWIPILLILLDYGHGGMHNGCVRRLCWRIEWPTTLRAKLGW